MKAGRDGSQNLAQVIEMHSPLKLVILLLGTNDFQCTHDNNAWLSAQGSAKLINIIRQAPTEPSMPIPDIMVIAPPAITMVKGVLANKFNGAVERSANLANELEQVAKQYSTYFFDVNDVTDASVVDGIHLDKNQHEILGKKIAANVLSLEFF